MALRPARAFVIGGGGVLGAAEVGMLAALLDAGILPDVVLGTSVGAINGAMFAAGPEQRTIDRLVTLWSSEASSTVFSGSALARVSTLAKTRTHAHDAAPLRQLLVDELGHISFEQLVVPFQCVAASIERASEHWFTEGLVVPAVMASAAVPGLLPPVVIDDEHFLDGGLVHSIPVGRALTLGAREVFVLHVGRIERPLEPPKRPWEVAAVAFEIARRHRFAAEMAAVPPDVVVHVLPTGGDEPPKYADLSALRYRDASKVSDRIEAAREATAAYLRDVAAGTRAPASPAGHAGTP